MEAEHSVTFVKFVVDTTTKKWAVQDKAKVPIYSWKNHNRKQFKPLKRSTAAVYREQGKDEAWI